MTGNHRQISIWVPKSKFSKKKETIERLRSETEGSRIGVVGRTRGRMSHCEPKIGGCNSLGASSAHSHIIEDPDNQLEDPRMRAS